MDIMQTNNYSTSEIEHFNQYAYEWWDTNGALKTLHQINPIRLKWIEQHINLANKNILDVGCGGGILAHSLALKNANVTAIDMASSAIEVAKLHAVDTKVNVNYQCTSIEELANNEQYIHSFDAITCMEMLEHVPNPQSIIESCYKLVKPKGLVFFSTLNRNLKTYLSAILTAEYILKMLPKGTHDYEKCIKPSELAIWCEKANLNPLEFKGIGYSMIFNAFYLQKSIDVNYLLVTQASDL